MLKVTKQEIEEVLDDLVEKAKIRMVKRKGKPHVNRHEFLGKLTEEVDELTFAIRKEKRSSIREETLDVAEACLYFLASELVKKKSRKVNKKAKKE